MCMKILQVYTAVLYDEILNVLVKSTVAGMDH